MPQDGRSDRRTAAGTITGLLRHFGERWQIAYQSELGVWSGERVSSDGAHIRFLAAHSPAELVGKLSAAERDEDLIGQRHTPATMPAGGPR